jgi:hypothetical protein
MYILYNGFLSTKYKREAYTLFPESIQMFTHRKPFDRKSIDEKSFDVNSFNRNSFR